METISANEINFFFSVKESLNSWRVFIAQLVTRQRSERPLRLKKHEMIAQAFTKRRELQENGRLSLTLQSAHPDPVGKILYVQEVVTHCI